MTKSTITRERLEWLSQISCRDDIEDICGDEIRELASMALAAMDSEPVAEITEDLGRLFVKIHYPTMLRPGDKLYRHAKPVPEAMPECFRNAVSALESLYRNGQKQCWNDRYTTDMAYASGVLNACRAAMLQSEPVTTANKLERGEDCWSCGKYFTYTQHSECDGYCPHCDSPVDIDDEEDQASKVVPTEPTEEMISNAWREATGTCDHETIKRIYATMLASAPQEVGDA